MREKSTFLRPVWSVIGLNVGWFACVLGAAWEIYWLSIVIVLLLIVIHFFVIGKERLLPAILLGLASLVVGFVLDTGLIAIETYEPNRWLIPAPITTIWLLMLWVNFSLALNESLKWFQKHLLIAAITGSIFGPLAYFAASSLEAVQIMTPVSRSLAKVGIVWFIAMPLMSLVAKYIYHYPLRFRNK
jgi:type VI protein secretion system component VasK